MIEPFSLGCKGSFFLIIINMSTAQLKPPIGLRMASPAPNNSGISMPTKNNPFTPNNPLIRPPLLGNGILPGANPLTHPMLQHSANNLLGLRGPNFPGQSLRGRLGIGPLAAAMSGVANINGGPIRPAIRSLDVAFKYCFK